MKSQPSRRYISPTLVINVLALLCFCFWQSVEAKPGKLKRMPPGVWGGEHMGLWVEKDGARIEYDCAHGTIDEPLILDRRGRFNVKGTHSKEHGGPVRMDEQNTSRPARYTGALAGNTLRITVVFEDTKETIGSFRLVHNREPHLVKCLGPRRPN